MPPWKTRRHSWGGVSTEEGVTDSADFNSAEDATAVSSAPAAAHFYGGASVIAPAKDDGLLQAAKSTPLPDPARPPKLPGHVLREDHDNDLT